MSVLSSLLARFRQNEDGSIAVETVIMLPLMFWSLSWQRIEKYIFRQTSTFQSSLRIKPCSAGGEDTLR